MKSEILAGKRALGTASCEDYAGWAECFLYEGVESDNVAILASFGIETNPDSLEVEEYFQRSLKDLGITLPGEMESLRDYAIEVCEQISSGEIEPGCGVDILAAFYSGSDYETIYCIWDELAEDLWLVGDRDYTIWNTGITKENSDEYIKGVASQFIKLLATELPEDFFDMSACPNCGHIGASEFEVVDKRWMPDKLFRLIYRRGQTQRAVCARCKTAFPNSMHDYEGRRQYFAKSC